MGGARARDGGGAGALAAGHRRRRRQPRAADQRRAGGGQDAPGARAVHPGADVSRRRARGRVLCRGGRALCAAGPGDPGRLIGQAPGAVRAGGPAHAGARAARSLPGSMAQPAAGGASRAATPLRERVPVLPGPRAAAADRGGRALGRRRHAGRAATPGAPRAGRAGAHVDRADLPRGGARQRPRPQRHAARPQPRAPGHAHQAGATEPRGDGRDAGRHLCRRGADRVPGRHLPRDRGQSFLHRRGLQGAGRGGRAARGGSERRTAPGYTASKDTGAGRAWRTWRSRKASAWRSRRG